MACLGIVGPNFGGSTVAGAILEAYEQVVHVGEIWKTRVPRQSENAFCRECGPNQSCPRFNADVMTALKRLPKEEIWRFCATEFGAEWIVSGDKNPGHYANRTGMPDRLMVLLKNPLSAAFSYMRRTRKAAAAGPVIEASELPNLEKGLKEYAVELERRYKWAKKTRRPYVACSIEFLSAASADRLNEISSAIWGGERRYRPEQLKQNMHYIGGNHKISVGKENKYFSKSFRPDYRYKDVLSQEAMSGLLEVYREKYDFRRFVEADKQVGETDWLQDPSVLLPA